VRRIGRTTGNSQVGDLQPDHKDCRHATADRLRPLSEVTVPVGLLQCDLLESVSAVEMISSVTMEVI
jgi:hypothetical protein